MGLQRPQIHQSPKGVLGDGPGLAEDESPSYILPSSEVPIVLSSVELVERS